MGSSESYRGKVCDRQIKATVDKNLQFRLPKNEVFEGTNEGHHPIYSRSHGENSVQDAIPADIDEVELIQRMQEADAAFEAWSRLKRHIEDEAKKF